MAYLPKNKGVYVVLAVQIFQDNIFYHCAGASTNINGAMAYAANYEQYYRDKGWELIEANDDMERAEFYESSWIDEYGNQAFLKIQKSALMQ